MWLDYGTMKKLNRRIRALREIAGLTQEELGAAICVGKAAVSAWERGRATPSSDDLPAIAKALGVEVGDLFEAPRRRVVVA